MAGYDVRELLSPAVIQRVISQIALPGTSLSKIFGWNVGNGPVPGALFQEGNIAEGNQTSMRGNFDDSPARTAQYDVFDNTRKVARARAPGQEAEFIEPQRVGVVNYTVPRSAEKMRLPYEALNNQRPIGGPVATVDRKGALYIRNQTRYIAARAANLIEFQTAAMLRGKYYFVQRGDSLYQSFTDPSVAGTIEIDYQIPATHKAQLDLGTGSDIIGASWATSSTDIPDHCYKINAAQLENTGFGITDVVTSSKVWNAVLNNDAVQSQAGTARSPFDYVKKTGEGEFTAVLHGIPWLKWHVVDYGLDVFNPSTGLEEYTRVIPENSAIFLGPINSSWTTYMRYGETVVEGPNGASDFRWGMYTFGYPSHDPAAWILNCIHNGFPALFVPKAIVHGTVIF